MFKNSLEKKIEKVITSYIKQNSDVKVVSLEEDLVAGYGLSSIQLIDLFDEIKSGCCMNLNVVSLLAGDSKSINELIIEIVNNKHDS